MPTQVTNYQCPSCTGPLHFSGASGRLECEYCGASYAVAEIEALYAEKEKKAAEAQQATEEGGAGQGAPAADGGAWDTSDFCEDWGAEGDGMRAYGCPSCGAELICEESTAATSCPYCGNPTVVPGQFSGALRPDFIVPFKLSKEDAVSALKQHYKGKLLLPKLFRDNNHIEELRGIYVPFWLFDGEAEGSANYMATTTRVFRHGDTEITETSFYEVQRAGTLPFSRVPVDASRKMPDDYMDSIEPFDYAGLKPFSTAYLPGFFADKFDVSIEESSSRADKRCRQSLSDALQGTARNGRPYTSVMPTGEDIHLKRTGVHYALLPVWMLNTRWNGKNYMFAMNGQTGRMVGDLPVDRKRFWGLFAAVAAPMTAVLTALLYFL